MTDRVDIQNILAQMRHIKAELNQQASPRLSSFVERVDHSYLHGSVNPNTSNFSTMFRQAIDHVNGKQAIAGQLAERFELGDSQVDLTEVMVALQKASISFQAMTEVRDKLVEAYKNIMNMSI